MNIKILAAVLLFLVCSHSQLLAEVDFKNGATYTGSYMWQNFIGISLEYDNVDNFLNNSLFQSYLLNSNVMGDWANNFAVSIKTPLGHKYNCSALRQDVTNPNVTCTFQTQANATYWNHLGWFIWNTQNQPNWCIGYDMQGVNLTITSHQDIFYDWAYKVYQATFFGLFCAELVDYGDKMVDRKYKTSYSPANFVKDIENANYVVYVIAHSGPGFTEDASKDWLTALEDFSKVAFMGHYTARCIVFKDPTKMTIDQILSDNATKYYLEKRFTVNESYAYNDFSYLWLGINDIKLTTGDGVDGLTNTFAAALWAIDITMEFILMNGWEIDFNHFFKATNYQSLFTPSPEFKPTALYYGLMFAVLVRQNSPQVVLPSMQSYISSKIKAFGFTTGDIFKIVLLNKDTNASLNGTVLIKSELTGSLKCIYLQAPSLTSKDGIKIAGYNFLGGNATVNGTFTQKKVQYSYAADGYQIPIKYAQAVLCQTADSKFNWPAGTPKSQFRLVYGMAALLLFLALLL